MEMQDSLFKKQEKAFPPFRRLWLYLPGGFSWPFDVQVPWAQGCLQGQSRPSPGAAPHNFAHGEGAPDPDPSDLKLLLVATVARWPGTFLRVVEERLEVGPRGSQASSPGAPSRVPRDFSHKTQSKDKVRNCRRELQSIKLQAHDLSEPQAPCDRVGHLSMKPVLWLVRGRVGTETHLFPSLDSSDPLDR